MDTALTSLSTGKFFTANGKFLRINKSSVVIFNLYGVGGQHVLYQKTDNTTWSWGNNEHGQLGINSNLTGVSYSTPVAILGSSKTFCRLVPTNLTSIVIDIYAKSWSWGYATLGNLGNNQIVKCLTPVAVCGNHTICQINPGSGGAFASIIDNNGKIWSWGHGAQGQIGVNSILNYSTPVAILGVNKTFCKIFGGWYCCFGVDKNNKTWCWGFNRYGVLGINSQVCKSTPTAILGVNKTFCQITPAYYHSLGLDKNGKIWSWVYNSYGQLGLNSIVLRSTPTAIMGVNKTFCRIASGFYHSLAIDKDGTLWSWGYNLYGQLGINSNVQKSTPIAILGVKKTFCQVFCGQDFSLSMEKNGKLWSWGNNTYGQLGDNTKNNRSTPVAVCNL